MKTSLRIAVAAAAAVVAGFAVAVREPARAADHGDSPQVRRDPRLDINDLYAFVSPADSSRSVLIMTVSPAAGITSPSEFANGATYEFAIDQTGDAVEDVVYRFTFGNPLSVATQPVKVQRIGSGKFTARGTVGEDVALPDGGVVRAGLFDDPFFFDLLAFRGGLAFDESGGKNFFRGLNTMAIVLEVPNTSLNGATSAIGVWARTKKGGKQIDRTGRPAINTVLVNAAKKDLFNRGRPKDDTAFRADAAAIITSLGNPDGASGLVGVLFPDVLTFDTSNTGGFLNGRRLEDDVIDAELQLLTGNGAASDFVGNDSAFSNTFPYLAPKNP